VDEHTGGEFENTPNISARSSYGLGRRRRPAVSTTFSVQALTTPWVPRTPSEAAAFLRGRPPGWEDLLFAAVLLREKQALEPKFRDHELK
jgi:hypothetical protein